MTDDEREARERRSFCISQSEISASGTHTAGSITPPYKLGKGRHLFEKLHGKDPYAQVLALERLGAGITKYKVVEVE